MTKPFFSRAAALAGLSWQAVRQARALEVETPDLARLEDGVYQGEWSIPPVTAGVEVTMEDGRDRKSTRLNSSH